MYPPAASSQNRRRLQLRQLENRGRGQLRLARVDRGDQRPLEEPAQRVQGEGPRVALAGDELVQHAQRDRLAFASAELEAAGEHRHPAEIGVLGEIPAQLQIRIEPRLRLAEQLEEQPVAQIDRGVGLLAAQHRGAQRLVLAAERGEGPGAASHQLAARRRASAACGPSRPPARSRTPRRPWRRRARPRPRANRMTEPGDASAISRARSPSA